MENNNIPIQFLKELDNMKELVVDTLSVLGVPFEDKRIRYKRYSNGEAILGIQLGSGEVDDVTNYMVNISRSEVMGKKVSCDIGYHADGKIGGVSLNVANLLNGRIIDFFMNGENILYGLDKYDLEMEVDIPLVDVKDKSKPKGILRKLFSR